MFAVKVCLSSKSESGFGGKPRITCTEGYVVTTWVSYLPVGLVIVHTYLRVYILSVIGSV